MYTGSFGSASNRGDWRFSIGFDDEETGEPLDLTGASIEIAIAEKEAKTSVVNGNSSDGVVEISTPATAGEASFVFSRALMQRLEAGQYDVGIVITLADGEAIPVAKGNVAIIHGVVAKQ